MNLNPIEASNPIAQLSGISKRGDQRRAERAFFKGAEFVSF